MRPTPRAPTVAKEVTIEAVVMKVMAIKTMINKVVIRSLVKDVNMAMEFLSCERY